MLLTMRRTLTQKQAPSLEQSLRVERRNANIRKAVLATIAATGGLAVAAVAPNALSLLRPALKYQRQQKYRANRVFSRLIADGSIFLEKTKKGSFARVTPKGERFLQIAELRHYSFKKPRRWDKKWRIIIFDIPEKRKAVRDYFRRTFTEIGFVRLQDSVWVYPYDCEALIMLLKTEKRIGNYVLYLIVDRLENDKKLRLHFGL